MHFMILSEDGDVQECAFSEGSSTLVNFSPDFVGSVPGAFNSSPSKKLFPQDE
jgi:hypothetical protein